MAQVLDPGLGVPHPPDPWGLGAGLGPRIQPRQDRLPALVHGAPPGERQCRPLPKGVRNILGTWDKCKEIIFPYLCLSQVVLPYYEKYSSDIDKMMAEAASSAEVIIKTAVDKVEDTKTE